VIEGEEHAACIQEEGFSERVRYFYVLRVEAVIGLIKRPISYF